MMHTKGTRFSLRNLMLLVGVATLIGGSLVLYQRFLAGPPDFSGPGQGSINVTVTTGESLATIGNALKAAGVVKSVDAFIAASTQNSKSATIQPGKYALKLQMTSHDALDQLISGKSRTSTAIVIPEGLRTTEILERIAAQSTISLSALKYEVSQPATLGLPAPARGNVEGYLFPSSYEIDGNTTAHSLLSRMIAQSRIQHERLMLSAQARKLSLSSEQVLTVASILQAEAHPRDYTKVARVIYNRISTPMRLQMDSTVAYGAGVKRVMLTQKQLDTDTPYNTYLRDGLPPTPINNPGAEAIQAALQPAAGNWLFFLTVNLDTQETKFTNSYNDFLTYKSQFLSYCSTHEGKC